MVLLRGEWTGRLRDPAAVRKAPGGCAASRDHVHSRPGSAGHQSGAADRVGVHEPTVAKRLLAVRTRRRLSYRRRTPLERCRSGEWRQGENMDSSQSALELIAKVLPGKREVC